MKKANVGAGFNQVDKRPVDKYKDFWKIPTAICDTLKLYTGEAPPIKGTELKDNRRMFLNEMDKNRVDALLKFFSDNF